MQPDDESELTRFRHGERTDWQQRYRNWASKVWADAHNFVTRYRSQTDVALGERDELLELLADVWQQFAVPGKDGKLWAGGLSTLEAVDRALHEKGVGNG